MRPRLLLTLVALLMPPAACSRSKSSPPQPEKLAENQPPPDLDTPAPPSNLAAVAEALKLDISGLTPVTHPAVNESTQTDAGRILGARFMPDNAPCVSLPAKVKGVYEPVTAGQLDGQLVFAPGLTLDDLTACFVALGGKPDEVRSLGPATRELPGFGDRPAFVDLHHGWLFAAPDLDRAVDQLVHSRMQR